MATERPLPPFKDMLRGYLVLFAVAGSLFCLAMIVAAIVASMKESLPQYVGLAHPRRHILFRVGHLAWLTAILSATVVSGISIFRRRAPNG